MDAKDETDCAYTSTSCPNGYITSGQSCFKYLVQHDGSDDTGDYKKTVILHFNLNYYSYGILFTY